MQVQVDVIQGVSDIDVHLSTPKQKVTSNGNSPDNSHEIHVKKRKTTYCSKSITSSKFRSATYLLIRNKFDMLT